MPIPQKFMRRGLKGLKPLAGKAEAKTLTYELGKGPGAQEKQASDKAYIYTGGKFNVPLRDIDPLTYAGSRSVARITPREITADQAFEVLKRNPKEFRRAPWAVRHPVLTGLAGMGIGAAGGAGIGAMFKPRGAAAALGALMGTIPGVLGGGLHAGTKSIAHLDLLRKQKKLKTASAATQVIGDIAPWVLIPAGFGGIIGGVAEPRKRGKGRTKERARNIGIGALMGGLLGLGPGARFASERAAQRGAQQIYQNVSRVRGMPKPANPFSPPRSKPKPGVGSYRNQPPPPAPPPVTPGPKPPSGRSGKVQDIHDWADMLKKNPDALKANTKFGLPIDPFEIKNRSISDLKTGYRRAMKKAHPDIGGSPADASAVNQWKTLVEGIKKEKLASLFEDSFFDEINAIIAV